MMACLKNQFDQMMWMGGSPCSWKTSIADLLTDQRDLVVYHVDESLHDLERQITPEKQPNLYKWTHNPKQTLESSVKFRDCAKARDVSII